MILRYWRKYGKRGLVVLGLALLLAIAVALVYSFVTQKQSFPQWVVSQKSKLTKLLAVQIFTPESEATKLTVSDQNFIRIGAGPPSETLFALARRISAIISRPAGSSPCDESGICGVGGLVVAAQSSKGEIDDLQNLRSGRTDTALVTLDLAYSAYYGVGQFEGEMPFSDLRVLAVLNPVKLHVYVREESTIKELRDLQHKVISFGSEGSPQSRIGQRLLQAVSLKEGDYRPQYLNPDKSLEALENGGIDAIIDLGHDPLDSEAQHYHNHHIRLLELDPAAVNATLSLNSALRQATIPANLFINQPKEQPTLALDVVWVTTDKIPPSLALSIVKALWHGQLAQLYRQLNARMAAPEIEAIKRASPLPILSGADSYYRSQGLL